RPGRPLVDWRQRLDHRPQVIIDDPPTLTAPLLPPTLPTPHAIKNEPKTKKLRVLSPRPAVRRPSCGHSSRRGANRVWARRSRRLSSGNSQGSRARAEEKGRPSTLTALFFRPPCSREILPPADPKAPPDSKRQTARTSQVRTVSYVLI